MSCIFFNNKKKDSSAGRAAVSKTEGQGFKPLFFCFFVEKIDLPVLAALLFSFLCLGNLQIVEKVAGLKLEFVPHLLS